MIPVTKFTYGFLLFCTMLFPILAGFTLADWAKESTPEPPTAYTLETRCNNNVLEVRLKENNEGFTKWFPDKNSNCEVAKEKPLEPVEALKMKLLSKDTCPAHCICPETRELDACILELGLCKRQP